ncbi:MAG: transporter [Candidatus Zixiibacteriota bacterium]|nr:MAG: transporter [candidate division Zixibacteria bacterium]
MKTVILILVSLLLSTAWSDIAWATGISIDAGLTPPQNRWILRSQVRYMKRDHDPTPMQREMTSYLFPVVVAYGLRSDLTVMMRQIVRRNEMSMITGNSSQSGFADLLLMTKFRMLRINLPGYTLGVAPTIGLEMPIGAEAFSSNTWDLRLGCFVSGRIREWGFDCNLAYAWNGMIKTAGSNLDPGHEFSLEAALGVQIGLGKEALLAVAPVLETSYRRTRADVADGQKVNNTGESVFLLSPGIKLTRSSLIWEFLAQFPVWQKQEGEQLERAAALLAGVRFMY